jgi:hypothetical protein
MTKHIPKLLVLLAIFSVAPVSAERLANAHRHSAAECPYARAKARAAAAAVANPAAAKQAKPAGTTITLIDRVPAGSLFGHGSLTP